MEQLPLELVLQIISYLPIRTIHVVQALSTLFNSIIKENANQVYRSAAFLHKFVGGQALKGNPVSALKHATRHYLSTWMDDVEDWRSFCKCFFYRVVPHPSTYLRQEYFYGGSPVEWRKAKELAFPLKS